MAVFVRPPSVGSIVIAAAIAVGGAGCGDGGEPGPPATADTATATEPADAGADTAPAAPAVTPVPLPADFPDDFPVPPMSTVTRADVETADDGTFTNVTIRSEGDPESGYAWFRDGLERAGWTVTTEGTADGARSLHAALGESYVDLTVVEDSPGWTRAEAAIWKIHP